MFHYNTRKDNIKMEIEYLAKLNEKYMPFLHCISNFEPV